MNIIDIKFPIMGAGNPLKKAVKLAAKIKKELNIDATLSNAGPGDFETAPEPYSIVLNGKNIWQAKSLIIEDAFKSIVDNL